MKKVLFTAVVAVVAVLFAVFAYSATVVYQPGTSGTSTMNSDIRYCYVYETDGAVNDFTTDEFTIGNAIIERVVVDANGTDTSFKVYLYDCSTTYNDVLIWSKTNLSTASMPVSQAVILSDGTYSYVGYPVNGNLKITLADGDDATLDRLEVYVYYRRHGGISSNRGPRSAYGMPWVLASAWNFNNDAEAWILGLPAFRYAEGI